MNEARPDSVIAEKVPLIRCEQCGQSLNVKTLKAFSLAECPDCGTRQRVPLRMGSFLLLREVGRGGMGIVYHALDESLKRQVAVKVMRAESDKDSQHTDGFLREARAAAALNHPNIVQIYSCGTEWEQPYIVMELVKGGRLEGVLDASRPVQEDFVLRVAEDVARGLNAALEAGLVHGDIKPANILFDEQGTAKVVDFGLARFIRQRESDEVWGTPYYLAPEKARGQKGDHRSDIYSLGATLYHVLSRRPPFDGATAADVVAARLKKDPQPLSGIRPDIHPVTERIIARMLEREPVKRFPTYKSLLSDLGHAREELSKSGTGEKGRSGPSSRRRVIVRFAALAALVVLLVGGVTWAVRALRRPTPVGPAQHALPRGFTTLPIDEEVPKSAERVPEDTDPGPAESSADDLPETGQGVLRPEEDQALARALARLAVGHSFGASEVIENLYRQRHEGDPKRFWLRLVQAAAAQSGREEEAATAYLDDIVLLLPDAQADTLAPTVRWVAALAHYLRGSLVPEESDTSPAVSPEEILADLLDGAPEGVRTLALFFQGLTHLRRENPEQALPLLQAYADTQAVEEEPAWPYGFQAAANAWVEQFHQWETLQNETTGQIERGETAAARKALENFQQTAGPFLAPLAQEQLNEVRREERRRQAAREEAARAAHAQQVEKDMERLLELRRAARPLLARKDFSQAVDSVRGQEDTFETDEGRHALRTLRTAYRRQQALKQFLISAIQQDPMRQPVAELGGSMVGAGQDGIRVQVGEHGELVRSWERMSMPLFLRLATHYIPRSRLSAQDRAVHFMAVATLYYEAGAAEHAARMATQAADEHPELADDIRVLMPDLPVD